MELFDYVISSQTPSRYQYHLRTPEDEYVNDLGHGKRCIPFSAQLQVGTGQSLSNQMHFAYTRKIGRWFVVRARQRERFA